MPKIITDWAKKVLKAWKIKDKWQAIAIIKSTLTRAWELDSKWNLTSLWKKRNAMTPAQRKANPIKKTTGMVTKSSSASAKIYMTKIKK